MVSTFLMNGAPHPTTPLLFFIRCEIWHHVLLWHFVIHIAPQSQLDVLSLFQFYSLLLRKMEALKYLLVKNQWLYLKWVNVSSYPAEINEMLISITRDEVRWWWRCISVQMLRCVSNPCSRYAIMHSVFFYSHLQLSRLEMRCLFNNHLLRYLHLSIWGSRTLS